MNLVETYVNNQPSIDAQTTVTATNSRPPQIKAQTTVTASKSSQMEAQKPVTISNGWWFKFKKRNPSISLRTRDSTAGVRMSAVNSENINYYFDLLEEVLNNMGLMITQKPYTTWIRLAYPWNHVPPRLLLRKGKRK